MRNTFLKALAAVVTLAPAVGFAQSKPTSATYITDEDVKTVNALPGVDRTIRVVDIGPENFAIGVIHRGASGAAARGTGAGAGGGAAAAGGAVAGRGVGGGTAEAGCVGAGCGAGGGAAAGGAGRGAGGGAAQGEPCGEQSTAPAAGGTPGMIAHDQQTEGYLIISGGGTLVTGGKIVNGRKSPPEGEVTKVLNGPSCSGTAVGADVVKKMVKTGDIIIIPAGVPHG